jgi:hypothetical protein
MRKLEALIKRHKQLLSERFLWEQTIKEVKGRLDKGKWAYNKKRPAPDTDDGSTDVDLSNVNEWILSSASHNGFVTISST